MLNEIVHIGITVSDMECSSSFYGNRGKNLLRDEPSPHTTAPETGAPNRVPVSL